MPLAKDLDNRFARGQSRQPHCARERHAPPSESLNRARVLAVPGIVRYLYWDVCLRHT